MAGGAVQGCRACSHQTGDIVRFSRVCEDRPVHSEPDLVCDEYFLSVLSGRENELRGMCDYRNVECWASRVTAPLRDVSRSSAESPFIGLSKIHGTVSDEEPTLSRVLRVVGSAGASRLSFSFLLKFGSLRERGLTQFRATLPQGRALSCCNIYRSTTIATEIHDGRPYVASVRLKTWKIGTCDN